MRNTDWCDRLVWEDNASLAERKWQARSEQMHEEIPKKLLFHLQLKGLEYGGFLDDWGVYDIVNKKILSHRAPIIPHVSAIVTGHDASLRHPSYDAWYAQAIDLDHNNEIKTDIVTYHYPDDYVVS